jgi:DNA polymerase III sliding clamp (beta) subunit (PCNA family)
MIPLPAIPAIQALDGDTVHIGESPSYYYFKSSQTRIYASKLNKASPNYKSLLPKSFAFSATVDSAEMKRILHTIEPMIQDIEQFGVVVHFLDGRINLRTVGKGSVAEDEMEYLADPLADVTEFKIKMNHRFLSDYFAAASGEVVFNANKPDTPAILESGNRKIMIAPIAGGSK